MDPIWGNCEGYPCTQDFRAFLDYIAEHNVDTTLFYAAIASTTVRYMGSSGARHRTRLPAGRRRRFEAHERASDPASQPSGARRGVLFGLATTVVLSGRQVMSDRHAEFVKAFPERRTHGGVDLSLMPTVFDKLEPGLVDAPVYRGWWLTGAILAQCYTELMPPVTSLAPPPIPPSD